MPTNPTPSDHEGLFDEILQESNVVDRGDVVAGQQPGAATEAVSASDALPTGEKAAATQSLHRYRVEQPTAGEPSASASAAARAGATGPTAATLSQHPTGAAPPVSSLTDGPSAQLYAAWKEVDEDGSGLVSRPEFERIEQSLGVKKVNEAWIEAIAFMKGRSKEKLSVLDAARLQHTEVNYYAFIHAFNAVMGAERRMQRQFVRSVFLSIQTRPSGLIKEEMSKFVRRTVNRLNLLPPEFDIATDWEGMMLECTVRRTHALGQHAVDGRGETAVKNKRAIDHQLGTLNIEPSKASSDGTTATDPEEKLNTISFPEFEKWWKRRMGLWETNQPVIPEFFEYKLADISQRTGEQQKKVSQLLACVYTCRLECTLVHSVRLDPSLLLLLLLLLI